MIKGYKSTKNLPKLFSDDLIRKIFYKYYKRWKKEIQFLSDSQKIFENRYMQKIIRMGWVVVPLIIDELREDPHWLIRALHIITGANPVKKEHVGHLGEIASDWIEWYDKYCMNEIIANQERISASAIELTNGHIFVGKRHSDASKKAMAILGEDIFLKEKVCKEGYLTSYMRFIDRTEAYLIAKHNGQFKRYELQKANNVANGYHGKELFSEDLW